MKTQDLTFTLIVDQTPEVVFNAVNNVRGWWSETLEGDSEKLNDEFIYRYQDMHYSKQRLVEVVLNQKVVWLVLDSYLSFIEDKTEWTGTKISFEITREQDKTQLLFTHHGLNPEVECYNACFDGWSHYIKGSLVELIAKGERVSSN